ncbi:MAG TPA: hypothetical protein VFD32_06350 [Dehalococcoidia bacterium]|jgi:hypothetical protein|nr:hypothetical protein [Dehalococcoidia bacterium]
MPAARCEFCTAPPYQEVAVMKWRGDERERLTIKLCGKHHTRIAKAGQKGWEHKEFRWKIGFW